MKVLWITNSLLPEALSVLKVEKELKGTGSWVLAIAEALRQKEGLSLYIVALSKLVKKITPIQCGVVTYYAIPNCKGDKSYHKEYEDAYKEICKNVKPDIVHIHGTEYPHSLAALRAFGAERTVVSIQGLVSVVAPVYMGGISKKEVWSNMTFHDLIRPNLMQQKREMTNRGGYEKELLREVRYVIGRTSWDYAHTWAINPKVEYFLCNEVLRQEFYSGDVWRYNTCNPHTIFASQGYYPIKGLHQLIDSLGIVKRYYPDVILRVAGYDFTYSNGKANDRFRISSYGRIIKKKIAQNRLGNRVAFTGPLNAKDMKREYLKANLFVCPSIIENSPNSLGEAQILGVPCLASYTGGIPDMMKGDECHLFHFDEVEMLAEKICRVFELKENVDTSPMYNVAIERHNPDTIVNSLIKVYETMVKK